MSQRQRGTRRTPDLLKSYASIAALLVVCGCGGGGGSAPQAAPSDATTINTATGWSDSPFISGDGQRLYFMYSRWNFGPWIVSGGTQPPILIGPDRTGLRHDNVNPFNESDIYMASRNADGSWATPVNLSLNGPYGDSSGMEINGGNTFVWLQGNGTTNNIVIATRNPDGSWTPASDLGPGINEHSPGVFQDNPHLSGDGQGLWFVSSRLGSGAQGGRDIWFSLFDSASGNWSAPVNVGTPINTVGEDDQFWFSPAQPASNVDLYWNGPQGIMHCVSNGSGCTTVPDIVTIPGCGFAAEVSITDDGQQMFFGCGDLTTGHVAIMYSEKQADGTWGAARPVD